MNVILKDIDFIVTCTSIGFKNLLEGSDCKIWLSQFTLLDLTPREKFLINPLIKQKTVYPYSFSTEEIILVYKLFKEFNLNITVSDASAIIMAQILENSIIINRNGIFKSICNKQNVKTDDFNGFFEHINKKARLNKQSSS